jgi:O-antigen chain-terminating methyltransferase
MTEPKPQPIAETSRPEPKDRLRTPDAPADPGTETEPEAQEAAPESDPKAEEPAAPAPPPDPNRRPRLKPHKKLERYVTAIFKLGRTEWQTKQALRRCAELETRLGGLDARLAQSDTRFADIDTRAGNLREEFQEMLGSLARLDENLSGLGAEQERRAALQSEYFRASLASLSRALSDMNARLDRLMMGEAAEAPDRDAPRPESFEAEGLTEFRAQFYRRLDDNRGDRRAERFKAYLPKVEAAVTRTCGKPVMDLGCGNGAWVSLLKRRGNPAFGIDSDPARIAQGAENDLDLRLGEAATVLAETEAGSLSVLSAHHLIEHLPFGKTAWIVREAMRVLAPGGLLLFEVPRDTALAGEAVRATAPASQEATSDDIFRVLFETAGFHPVELRYINTHENLNRVLSQPNVNQDLALLLFGPQDVAILGTKPEED